MVSLHIEMPFQEGGPLTLDQLDLGQHAEVRAVVGRGPMTVRLLEMGFVPGVEVSLVKRAPLGDPLELRLRGYHVSLRRAEARRVEVGRAKVSPAGLGAGGETPA
jgi:ferrous iron transport protein A